MDNIFTNLPPQHSADEEVTNLLVRPGMRIERIISTGQTTPPAEWYDQEWNEWVILLTGAGALLIDGEEERTLSPGDHVFIPARRPIASPGPTPISQQFGPPSISAQRKKPRVRKTPT